MSFSRMNGVRTDVKSSTRNRVDEMYTSLGRYAWKTMFGRLRST